jgi:branched-subunit amino acid aminotransferase/4-amino-4-deoxychorismate lyase
MELNGFPPAVEQLKALALTNYGHFTSMLVDDGRVRGLSLHMQRLTRDCMQLFDVELDTDRVRHFVRRALTDGTEPIVVRVTVYDPSMNFGTVGADADPHILVTTRPAPRGVPGALRLQAAAYRREIPSVKHTGLLGALKRRREAQREGFDDILFLNPDGTISEIATSNIGFIRDGRVVWPRAEALQGVTMTLINQALDEPVTSEPLTLSELPSMEAVFATNAASAIRAVASIDGAEWRSANNKDIRRLFELYLDIPGERV